MIAVKTRLASEQEFHDDPSTVKYLTWRELGICEAAYVTPGRHKFLKFIAIGLPLQVAIQTLISESKQYMQPVGHVFLDTDIVTNLNTLLTGKEEFEYSTEVSYKQLLS